ncbi:MAG: transporter, ATP-binding protein [Pseudomonadota bacterium]|jgi:ABC transport system ATP-binding/permease protein
MSLLSAHDIEKSYGAHRVLAGVTATLASGERVGLVGNNGSGKSTLVKVLAKVDTPDVGVVMQRRGSRTGYLPQLPELDESLTALQAASRGLESWQTVRHEHELLSRKLETEGDALDASERQRLLDRQADLAQEIEQMGGWDQEHRANAILQQLHVHDVNAKVATMSGGERRRVALSALLVSEPDVLILDEPTNHLDTDSIDWLEQYLEDNFKGALLVITHDRYFLDRVVQRTWEMNAGTVQSYQGGWEAYLTAKAEREAQETRTESNRQNFLRTELEWLRRQPKARGTKQKARISRAEGAIGTAAPKIARPVHLEVGSSRQGSEVLVLDKVSVERGGRTLIRDLELIVTPGQRIGVLGPNGAGKTSLFQTITQQVPPSAGVAKLGKNTRIGYFAQTRTELDESLSVAENVAGKRTMLTLGDREVSIYNYLERFLFRGEEIRKKVAVLSGGERARVALAKLLLSPANLLLLDEPTNDLDIMTMGSLEQMLCDFRGSVMVVSHDRYFLDRVATSILAFEGDGKVGHYEGDYSSYSRLRAERAKLALGAARAMPVAPASASSASAPAEPAAARAKPVKLTFKETRELAEIEQTIAKAEAEVTRLEQELADPGLYRRDPDRAALLSVELSTARRRVVQLMDRWQELESKREAFEPKR